jgi:uncharacterized membrane protein YeaQ/YmgE (transglycosylase-associated protein family)
MIESLLIGGLAGWLTGQFTKGEGYGIFMNIGLGIIGGWFGRWLLAALGFNTADAFVPNVITAVIGAFILVWAYKKFVK